MSSWCVSLSLSTLLLVIIASVVFILMATVVIGKLLDKKIGDIRVNVPRIRVPAPNVIIRMEGRPDQPFVAATATVEEPTKKDLGHPNAVQLYEPFLTVKFDDAKKSSTEGEAKIEDELGCKPIVVDTKTPPTTAKITVGCTKDADCNIVNGDGKNVCKADGTCSCLGGGSGLFCHYGPVNYRDPKDMTEAERRRFKSKYRANMTLQDYKNWLMLYRDDPEDLRDEHRKNLRILKQGGQLTMKDVPNLVVKSPIDAADYFQQMYKDGNIGVVFPDNNGPFTGANYGQYDEYEQPENISNAITGVVNVYQTGKDDAKATDWYMRPITTVGQEEQRTGDIYQQYVHTQQNLADLREIKRRQNGTTNGTNACQRQLAVPVESAVFSGETGLMTFLSGDPNADI